MIFSVSDPVKHIALKRPGQPSQRELAWLGPFPGIANLSLDGRTLLFMDWHPTIIHALLGATSGTPPKLLGAGLPLALSPDGRRVAMTSRDQHGLFLVPTGAGTTEEVPVSSLVVGSGQWSRDGHRLWIVARQNDQARFQLFPVDVATRKLLEPIPGSDILPTVIAISPDDPAGSQLRERPGPDRLPRQSGRARQDLRACRRISPHCRPAGRAPGNSWSVCRAPPPRVSSGSSSLAGRSPRSMDVDLREIGGDEMAEARITPDESLLAVESGLAKPARAHEGHPGRPLTSTGSGSAGRLSWRRGALPSGSEHSVVEGRQPLLLHPSSSGYTFRAPPGSTLPQSDGGDETRHRPRLGFEACA